MISVTLYTRKGCHLCDEVQAALNDLQAELPHRLTVQDVDLDLNLREALGSSVPVVEIGPYRLKAPISVQELRVSLAAAQDRARDLETLAAGQDRAGAPLPTLPWSRADGVSLWFARHYMSVFNLLVLIYVGLPFLAPVLMRAGVEPPARWIYRSYGMVCHQLGYRSFFLFGEQAAYPRASAHVSGLESFSQATGLGEGANAADIDAARRFVGSPQVGYKVALCERDIAIYGAILLFGLLFALTGMRLPGLPLWGWVVLGLGPIGLDGVSQLLSQPPFNLFPYRESTPFLRTLTGGLFGLTTAWFGYPLVEESMREARQALGDKWRRLNSGGRRV